jgi:putative chitinase
MEENLNYSAHRLVEVWPKRFFSTNAAEEYASNPEKLANFVYANRMGNGNEISGDGYRFRGRGPLMLTGRENYSDASTAILKTDRLVEFPDHVALDPYVGAAVAAWFWQARGCNELADQGDLDGLSRRINGGTIGLEDRIAKINRAREAFA